MCFSMKRLSKLICLSFTIFSILTLFGCGENTPTADSYDDSSKLIKVDTAGNERDLASFPWMKKYPFLAEHFSVTDPKDPKAHADRPASFATVPEENLIAKGTAQMWTTIDNQQIELSITDAQFLDDDALKQLLSEEHIAEMREVSGEPAENEGTLAVTIQMTNLEDTDVNIYWNNFHYVPIVESSPAGSTCTSEALISTSTQIKDDPHDGGIYTLAPKETAELTIFYYADTRYDLADLYLDMASINGSSYLKEHKQSDPSDYVVKKDRFLRLA